jgi:hypothetical protein
VAKSQRVLKPVHRKNSAVQEWLFKTSRGRTLMIAIICEEVTYA